METVLTYLSENIRKAILEELKNVVPEGIEEIRLRAEKNIAIKLCTKKIILNYITTTQDILETFQKVCEYSIYSYQKEICDGYITIKGGHRVGITGNCVVENGQIRNINYISSLNFRIAREKKNSSIEILKYIIKDNEIANTLIASKPGCGKTTILRDAIRKISTGIFKEELNSLSNFEAKTSGIVDERGEIASMYKGIPQNDVGILTDVISETSKSQGMHILIRSMAPEVIACDEIGTLEDLEAINYAICSGVKGIFTAHGDSIEDLFLNNQLRELLEKQIIEIIIILDDRIKGKVKNVYKLDKENKIYIKLF